MELPKLAFLEETRALRKGTWRDVVTEPLSLLARGCLAKGKPLERRGRGESSGLLNSAGGGRA